MARAVVERDLCRRVADRQVSAGPTAPGPKGPFEWEKILG